MSHSLSRPLLGRTEQINNETRYAKLHGLEITSAYQAIYSLAHQKTVGYEGLMRAFDSNQRAVSPKDVFSSLSTPETEHLDTVCRELHIQNLPPSKFDNHWLFLNVHSSVVTSIDKFRQSFIRILTNCCVKPHQIVIEILEDAISDASELASAVSMIKELGCLVAIDDFGAGHSNFDRIWRICPDIVKLDRSMVLESEANSGARSILPGLVSLLHEADCHVVMEGIETEQQALLAMECDVEFVQGFYFSTPVQPDRLLSETPPVLSSLQNTSRIHSSSKNSSCKNKLVGFIFEFELCAKSIVSNEEFENAFYRFINRELVECCYLLDGHGTQIGETVNGKCASIVSDPRYSPMHTSIGACWHRRPYFQRALANLNSVNVSRPYLSIRNAVRTITLSYGYCIDGKIYVICADLNWSASHLTNCIHG